MTEYIVAPNETGHHPAPTTAALVRQWAALAVLGVLTIVGPHRDAVRAEGSVSTDVALGRLRLFGCQNGVTFTSPAASMAISYSTFDQLTGSAFHFPIDSSNNRHLPQVWISRNLIIEAKQFASTVEAVGTHENAICDSNTRRSSTPEGDFLQAHIIDTGTELLPRDRTNDTAFLRYLPKHRFATAGAAAKPVGHPHNAPARRPR